MARIIDNVPAVSCARRSRPSQPVRPTRGLLSFAAGCMLLAALATPAIAFAAAAAPDAGGTLDLQTWPDSGQLIIVTAVNVPQDVKLPTVVRIPVPDGATVQWAGEVLGGELSADPERKYKLITSPVGGRYAEFTIEQTHTAQVDSAMPALTVTGDKTSATFEWTQSAASPYTSFSVRVPANANDVEVSPKPAGQPETNSAGERLYSGAPIKLAPGKKQPVTFSYSTGAAKPAAAASSGLDTLMFVLIAALAVAVVALIVVLMRQRTGTDAPPAAPERSRDASARAKAPAPEAPTKQSSDDDWGFDDTE